MAINKINTTVSKINNVLGSAQSVISRIPENLTNATRSNIVALTRQQDDKQTSVPDSIQEISNRLKQLETSQNISSQLSNFTPTIVESAVQRRVGSNTRVEGGKSDTSNKKSSSRKRIIKGVDPLTAAIANQLKAVAQLGIQKTQLLEQTNQLEAQINALSSKLAALTDAGAADAELRKLEEALDTYTLLYDNVKATLERIQKLYQKRYELLRKLRKKREELQKKFQDNYEKFLKILRAFKEIPKKLKFPKLPKLPTLNIRRGNLRLKIMDSVDKLKKASREAAKASIDKSKEEAREKIRDPKKGDAFQKAAANARNALAVARSKFDAANEIKNKATDAAVLGLRNQLKQLRTGITAAQNQILSTIDTAVAAQDKTVRKIREAEQRAKRLRDSGITNLEKVGNLVERASAGIASAQKVLNNELTKADIQTNPTLDDRTYSELQKIDNLRANITSFLNSVGAKKFTVGVGTGSTLAKARQTSLTLDKFKKEYPSDFASGNYQTKSEIGNVDGVYLVVTTVYQKGTGSNGI